MRDGGGSGKSPEAEGSQTSETSPTDLGTFPPTPPLHLAPLRHRGGATPGPARSARPRRGPPLRLSHLCFSCPSFSSRPHGVGPWNGSTVTEFILVGFGQSSPATQALLFALFLVLYSLAMAMNGLIIFITWTDPRLNSPMYFFLGHLSFLDICFITTTIPQMLIHLIVKDHAVSFASCLAQMYLVFGVGVAECILLAFMAYDRYVAICHPLGYAQIMSRQVCVKLVGTAWLFGLLNGILLDYMTFRGPFCRNNRIENFFCEAPIVITLSCGDAQFSLRVIFADAIVVLLSPMVLIIISYARILASILGRASSSGRGKTFSTCASHLTVVTFFYTSAMFSYMNPRSTHGPDKDKPFSLLYTIITPMCNPIIYSFRNKEMQGAMGRALGKTGLAQAESV
ncbi:olfactory receptor 10AD1-like [Dasypus novemcinctus]|uniref:olfactory receptor 10AD1-like n=1 Tax=Dasypus novemcinctus TaxID=9361 RepID=UPI00265FB5BE|nr:olfactory receptor 10AD1-like [Dasypus novemcinctus]